MDTLYCQTDGNFGSPRRCISGYVYEDVSRGTYLGMEDPLRKGMVISHGLGPQHKNSKGDRQLSCSVHLSLWLLTMGAEQATPCSHCAPATMNRGPSTMKDCTIKITPPFLELLPSGILSPQWEKCLRQFLNLSAIPPP